MKQAHLSSWQIEELVIAGPGQHDSTGLGSAEAHESSNAAMRHLETCEVCKASTERLQEFIDLYRESALIQSSATETKAYANPAAAPQPFWTLWRAAQWGVLAVIFLLAALVPIFLQQERGGRHQQQQGSTATQLATDNLLLQKVDEEVSYSVPQPLESLTDLAAEGSSTNQ